MLLAAWPETAIVAVEEHSWFPSMWIFVKSILMTFLAIKKWRQTHKNLLKLRMITRISTFNPQFKVMNPMQGNRLIWQSRQIARIITFPAHKDVWSTLNCSFLSLYPDNPILWVNYQTTVFPHPELHLPSSELKLGLFSDILLGKYIWRHLELDTFEYFRILEVTRKLYIGY